MAILEPDGHLALIHTCEKERNYLQHVSLVLMCRIIFLWRDEFYLHFFCYLVLGCSYQNLCWSSGVLFFSSLFKLYRTLTCKTWFSQEDYNGLWCERLLKYFLWSQIFCWFLLWVKVILYSVLLYQKHQYFKTPFVEKLSRKSFAVCEALL